MLLGGLACDSKSSSDEAGEVTATKTAGLERTARRSGVALTLRTDRDNAPYTEHVRLTVEAVAPQGVTVELAHYLDSLKRAGANGFEYHAVPRGTTTAEPIAEQRRRWSQTFDLEFYLPGSYELPAASARLSPNPAQPVETPSDTASTLEEAKAEELTTEPLTLTVRVPPGQTATKEELAQLTLPPPEELPPDPIDWAKWWWVLLVVPALALLVIVGLVLRGRRRRVRPDPESLIPPDEWALAELGKLMDAGLVAAGEYREFYYRLNEIVRGYVERGFDVAAPELTTEEFFANARAALILGPAEKHALGHFLTACDLVKYARHEPNGAERDEAVTAARSFIDRTSPRTRFLATRPQVGEVEVEVATSLAEQDAAAPASKR